MWVAVLGNEAFWTSSGFLSGMLKNDLVGYRAADLSLNFRVSGLQLSKGVKGVLNATK